MVARISAIIILVSAFAPSWNAAAQISARFAAASERSFSRPHDLVLSPDRRLLFVADVGNDVVKVVDPQTLKVLGTIGAGELSSPHDLAFDGAGRLLVADTGNDRVAIYAVDGARGRLVEEITGLSSPEGVAVAKDGRIYITNVGRHDVQAWQDTRRRIASRGGRGGGSNQYSRPHDVDVDGLGNVYVSDPGNNRIQVLDGTLNHLFDVGGDAHRFNEPKYFAIDRRGWLYVADEDNHRIKILDGARKIVAVIGTGERGQGPNLFNQPEGVEISGDDLWVSDTGNGRVVRYRLEGMPPLWPAPDGVVFCVRPRPKVCTMIFDPVRATADPDLKSGWKTYSNGCMACADPTVYGYRPAESTRAR